MGIERIKLPPIALDIRKRLLETFEDLEFDEPSHKYWIKGKEGIYLPSVSSLIKNFYEEFDSEIEGPKYAKKRGFATEQVLGAWDGENETAIHKGHKVHLFAEDYCNYIYFGGDKLYNPFCKQSLGVVEFWLNLPEYIVPVAFELRMYHPEYGYSGTADIVCLNMKTGNLIIMDYKTNKELHTDYPYTDKLFHVGESTGLMQDNFGKYSLQFSFYQILLERAGFKVGGRVLIWLQQEVEKPRRLYQTFQTIDLSKELNNLLENKLIKI